MFGWARTRETQLETERDVARKELAAANNEIDKLQLMNTLLERQLATSQSSVDWLRHIVNTLNNDRAALAASKGLTLPAPQIEGDLQTATTVAGKVEQAWGDGGGAIPSRIVGSALAEGGPDEAVDALKGLTHGFEDVGDEEADKLGIKHAEDGTLEYSR